MTNKTFAKVVAWIWLYGFVFTGVAASFTQDVRFGGAAFVLLLASVLSPMAAVW